MSPLAPGTRLGNYEVTSALGAGGMGEVYRARDPRLGRDVALKVLPEALATDPERLARFEREARAVAALNHPGIVTIHSIEQDGVTRFLTMELVDGAPLDHLIAPGGLPLARVLGLAIPLADALAAAHDRGIVHRDLKPGNVMVTADGRVKVLDFGLAKLDEPLPDAGDATQALTAAPVSTVGQVLGTMAYMAPEQLRGEPVDARADLFAFGVLLYELLTGRRPFAGRTSADLGSAILRDTPASLTDARNDLPHDVGRIVARCLEKDRELRFQTARDTRSELEVLRRAADSGTAVAAPAAASIAVLPFTNMSADKDNEFFADGLSEELLNVLAKNAALKVAGRTSSFAFKGKGEDLRTIGQKLGVATLLEGSVRRAGNRVRITAQLVKVADGFHLWSETYDRVLDDIFAVQDEIARAVAAALHVALLGGAAQPTRGVAQNFDVVLQANRLLAQQSESSLDQAVALYQQAIDAAPDDARAWAGLARTYSSQASQGFRDVLEGYRAARKAVDRALELDPVLAHAHESLGFMLAAFEYRWQDSVRACRRAYELAPNDSRVLATAAIMETAVGDMREGLRLAARAVDVNPLAAGVHIVHARVLSWNRRFEEAIAAARQAIELSPDMVGAHSSLATMLATLGRRDEAYAEAERERSRGYRYCALAIAHHLAGDAAASDRALAELFGEGEPWAFQFAAVHAVRGEADAAFEWLERAYFLHDSGIGLTNVSPFFDHLHADPRWPKLLDRFGLPRRDA